MGVLRVAPEWVEIEAAVTDEGRNGAVLRFPDNVLGQIELVIDLAMLGQINAEADGIRQTAMAWG